MAVLFLLAFSQCTVRSPSQPCWSTEIMTVFITVCSHHATMMVRNTVDCNGCLGCLAIRLQGSIYMYILKSDYRRLLLQCESKKSPPLKFSDIFPKQLGIFSPNFTRLLYVPIYAGLQIFTYIHTQIFIQLPATLTKLCHIKRDHHYMLKIKMSTIGWNACWVVALNMA